MRSHCDMRQNETSVFSSMKKLPSMLKLMCKMLRGPNKSK